MYDNLHFQIMDFKIDSHRIDGGPARINNVPEELIVAAAAFNHLISAKTSKLE
jgi:hypothetical protein